MTERSSKYANYRYSNYMQDGIAILKIGSERPEPAKPLNDRRTSDNNRNNNTLCSVKFDLFSNLPNVPKFEGRLNSRQNKPLYNEKAVRTTRNFIGKLYYNVGHYRIQIS